VARFTVRTKAGPNSLIHLLYGHGGHKSHPYMALKRSAAQRQQIAQIRREMAREEQRRIEAVLSPRQGQQLRREREEDR
jgi:hypothetical protein